MQKQYNINWDKLQEAMAELTHEYPDLAPEIERAGRLVTLRTVTQTGCNAWEVYDPATHEVCTVDFILDWNCSCQTHDGPETWRWWLGGWQPVCTHIAAAGLAWLACIPTESTPIQPAREFDPGRAYEKVNAVAQAHIERGDTQHLDGLHRAAGMLAAEERRRMQL